MLMQVWGQITPMMPHKELTQNRYSAHVKVGSTVKVLQNAWKGVKTLCGDHEVNMENHKMLQNIYRLKVALETIDDNY